MRSALNAPSVGATFQLHPKPTTGFLFFLGFGLLFAPHFWAGLFFQAKIFHLHFVCGGHGSRRNIPTPAWLKFTQLPAADMVYIHIEIYMYMPHSSSRSRCLQKTMPHVACRLAHLIKSLLRYLFNISLLFIDTFTMCEGCGKFLAVNHMRNKIGSITMPDWLSAFN